MSKLAKTEKNLPAVAIDYGTDAGDGLQDIGRDEAGIPFIKILQAQSPEVIGPNGKIDGAAAGMLLNTGTMELMDSVTIVPALREKLFVEWRPRKAGGGIAGVHKPDSPIVTAAIDASEEFGRYQTEAGNDLVETFYVYGVTLEDGEPSGFVVIPFSSTGIKHYKNKLMNRIRYCLVDNGQGRKVSPPFYAHQVRIGTTSETNDQGTWSNYDITFAVNNNVKESLLRPDSAAFLAGKELKSLFQSGAVKADLDKAEQTGSNDEADSVF